MPVSRHHPDQYRPYLFDRSEVFNHRCSIRPRSPIIIEMEEENLLDYTLIFGCVAGWFDFKADGIRLNTRPLTEAPEAMFPSQPVATGGQSGIWQLTIPAV